MSYMYNDMVTVRVSEHRSVLRHFDNPLVVFFRYIVLVPKGVGLGMRLQALCTVYRLAYECELACNSHLVCIRLSIFIQYSCITPCVFSDCQNEMYAQAGNG